MEHLRKIEINTGSEVSGDSFFNREKEFITFQRRLNSTKHIVISQIRRTGKTSFLKEFIKRNDELPIIYIIIQGSQNESQFYREIYKKVVEQSRGKKIQHFLQERWNTIAEMSPQNPYVSLGKISGVNDEQIKKYLKHVFQKKHFTLFIDEFPDFILTLKKKGILEPFLARFRDFRNECTNLHTVLTGSINLFRTVSKLGFSDKLNEYRTLNFPLFNKDNSLLLFRCLLFSIDYELDRKSQEYLLPYIEDGMPYFIQLLADEIQKLSPENKIIDFEILGKAIQNFYEQEEFGLEEFHNRLKKYLKEENLEKPSKIILSHLSHDKLSFDDLFSYIDEYLTKERLDELLNRLEDEAYIKKDGDEYSFLSKLMAGWWKNKKHFDRR